MTNTIISENYLSEAIQTVKEIFDRNNINAPFDRIRNIKWNGRIKNKLGYCRYSARLNVYEICLNKVLLNISKKKIISVLAHEIIHTVDGCFNHDTKFINISNMLNKAENLEINVRDERENIEEALESVGKLSSLYKYEAYCTKCGAHLRYISKGNADIVKNPETYRHRNCGGIVAVRRIVD